jgi:plastocyanin domain-containing protein
MASSAIRFSSTSSASPRQLASKLSLPSKVFTKAQKWQHNSTLCTVQGY